MLLSYPKTLAVPLLDAIVSPLSFLTFGMMLLFFSVFSCFLGLILSLMHFLICLLSSFNWCLSLFAIIFISLISFLSSSSSGVFSPHSPPPPHNLACLPLLLPPASVMFTLSTIIAFASHVGLNASAVDASFAFTFSSNFSTDSSRLGRTGRSSRYSRRAGFPTSTSSIGFCGASPRCSSRLLWVRWSPGAIALGTEHCLHIASFDLCAKVVLSVSFVSDVPAKVSVLSWITS